MNAKDTIMSPEDLVPYLSTTDLYSAMCVDYEKAFGRQAEITWDKAIGEVVEKLVAWRAQGTHLISSEAIKAIKDWGIK